MLTRETVDMILRSSKRPFIAWGFLCALVIASGIIGLINDRPVWPSLVLAAVLLLGHYLYLSRLLLELRIDEVIYRTLFKTTRVRVDDLGSIHYERMEARKGQFALVLRLTAGNRPVAILMPRAFHEEEWKRFVGELERRSGLRLNVPSFREIPKPAPEPARPRDLFLVLVVLGGTFGLSTVNREFPYLDMFPALTLAVGAAVFVVTLVWGAGARDRLASWGWQEGPATVWLGLVGLAALFAFFAVSLMKFTNGALDRSPPNYVRFTIMRRHKNSYLLDVRPAFASTTLVEDYYSLDISWDDWGSSAKGDIVLVDMRPGFLHLPWVAGYRTCGDDRKCGM
ncbi:MAG TPA: hypothetical protein VEL79_00870 [Vicinamibacterales bacterium]|nr:hypothetical protein [Vicinamibacterales bacterium]